MNEIKSKITAHMAYKANDGNLFNYMQLKRPRSHRIKRIYISISII